MATTFEFAISCEQRRVPAAEAILREGHACVAELERQLSEFLPDSPIYRLNHAPVGESVPLPVAAIELLQRSESFHLLTRGAFDCTAKSARKVHPGFQFDVEKGTAMRLSEQIWIGFGAIGKGYALDQVRALIEREGFSDYCLNAGGSSILLSGFASPDIPWSVGWSWQKKENQMMGITFSHHSGKPTALGISGVEEKSDHLIDSRSGTPTSRYKSALVATTNAAEADALSTALFVMGAEEALPAFEKLTPTPAIAWIDSDETPSWNGTFQNTWGPLS